MVAKFANHYGFEVTIFSETPENEQVLKENGVNIESHLSLTLENVKKNELKFDVAIVAGDIPK